MTKTTKIITGAIAILLIWAWSYAYISSNSGEENIVTSFIKKTLKIEENKSLNYSFNTKASLTIKERWRENGFDLEIKNASIISKDSGLKQRIQIEKAELNIIWEDKISLSNIDAVSDNEIVYYKWDYGLLAEKFSTKLKEILKKWKYAQINNSKPILDILWELWNNELIKELVIWMTTSNSEAYYEKNKTIEKLLTTLKTDYLINYVFKDWEYNEATKKTSLVFNEKLCELNAIAKNITPYIEKKDCIKDLKQANNFLSFINIYKEWDSKAGNYKFVINQWSAVDISVDYKNHIIDKWAFSIAEPTGKLIIRANWDTNKILSSLVKINIDESWIKANWEIKDWKWKIIISSDKNYEFTLNWFLDVSEYRLNSYELNWEFWELKLISKANKEKWELKITTGKDYSLDINYKDNIYNLDLKSKDINATWKVDKNKLTFNLDAKDYSGKQLAKIDLKADYSSLLNANYSLDLDIEKQLKIKSIWNLSEKKLDIDYVLFKYNWNKDFSIDFKSDFKEEKISLNAINYGYSLGEFNFDYNKWKIKWDFSKYKTKLVYIWNFKNLWDFDLQAELPEEDPLIKLIWKKEDEKYKYNLDITLKWKEFVKWQAEIKFEDNKIISNWNFKVKNKDFQFSIHSLQSAFEQYYQDTSEYPNKNNLVEWVSIYLDAKLTIVNKPWKNIFKYEVWDDDNWIEYSAYKIIDNKNKNVWLKIWNIKETFYIKVEPKNKRPDIKYSVNYNFEFDYKKWDSKYEIPKKFEKVDIKLLEMNVLPNFYESLNFNKNYSSRLKTWIIASVWVIWIWATASFNKELEKAEDSKRISDISTLSTVIRYSYVNEWTYPNKKNFLTNIWKRTNRIPKDFLIWKVIDWCEFGYKYEVWDDDNGIEYWAYKISTCTLTKWLIERWNLKKDNVKESFFINDLWEDWVDFTDL